MLRNRRSAAGQLGEIARSNHHFSQTLLLLDAASARHGRPAAPPLRRLSPVRLEVHRCLFGAGLDVRPACSSCGSETRGRSGRFVYW
jgi:hypothetical protein